MNRLLSCHLLWLLASLHTSVCAFVIQPPCGNINLGSRNQLASNQAPLFATTDSRRMGELTEPEQRVFDIMDNIHDSGFIFRMVVVGKGAILETTAALGPVLKVTQSPSTGANLLTLANEDQTFEFHLQLSEVTKMVLMEKETPKKTLRIIRILNADGESMSSLILADESEAAVAWYGELIAKYGKEIQL